VPCCRCGGATRERRWAAGGQSGCGRANRDGNYSALAKCTDASACFVAAAAAAAVAAVAACILRPRALQTVCKHRHVLLWVLQGCVCVWQPAQKAEQQPGCCCCCPACCSCIGAGRCHGCLHVERDTGATNMLLMAARYLPCALLTRAGRLAYPCVGWLLVLLIPGCHHHHPVTSCSKCRRKRADHISKATCLGPGGHLRVAHAPFSNSKSRMPVTTERAPLTIRTLCSCSLRGRGSRTPRAWSLTRQRARLRAVRAPLWTQAACRAHAACSGSGSAASGRRVWQRSKA
jgi:hypothetical protein